MPTWFLIALAPPLLYAVSNFIDKFLVEKYFRNTGIGALILFSSFAGLIVMPFLYVLDRQVMSIPFSHIISLVVIGMVSTLALLPYFYSLRRADTSAVIPYFQLIPLFGLLFGYIFLRETISIEQLIGMALVISGSLGITVIFGSARIGFDWFVCVSMTASSLVLAIASLAYKYFTLEDSYFISNFWLYVGSWVLAVIFFIGVPEYRRQFVDVFRVASAKVIGINFVNEIIALVAGLLVNFAYLLAPIALVMTVNGLQPVFVFLLGLILSALFPSLIRENMTPRIIFQRSICIGVVALGAMLLV